MDVGIVFLPDDSGSLKGSELCRSRDYLEKTTTVQYYDGIGRPTSLSIKGLNTSGKSVCSFAVNEMGAATYSLPIEMPASGGFEPHVSIVYNRDCRLILSVVDA